MRESNIALVMEDSTQLDRIKKVYLKEEALSIVKAVKTYHSSDI